jgi:hypothetical protein
MAQVTAEVPDTLAEDLNIEGPLSEGALSGELRIAASFGWFKQRRLTKVKAAKVAGLSLVKFSQLDKENFLLDFWSEFRPYALKLVFDFALTSSLWVVLFLFERLTSILKINGRVSEFIANVHAAGVVVAFSLFAMLFAIDFLKIRKTQL